jgi:Cu-Zn family superoxide dismutase
MRCNERARTCGVDPQAVALVARGLDAAAAWIETTAMSKTLLVSLTLVSLTASAALAEDKAKPVTVKLSDAKGKSVGTATLSPDPTGVKITLSLTGLPPGEHAVHVHETAKCDAPDFKSAGGHFNPEHKKHGSQNADGPHAGDVGNVTADAKGAVSTSIVDTGITLDAGPHSVFTGGGTALVIHAKVDDLKTDPTGAAGDRIACGVIKK